MCAQHALTAILVTERRQFHATNQNLLPKTCAQSVHQVIAAMVLRLHRVALDHMDTADHAFSGVFVQTDTMRHANRPARMIVNATKICVRAQMERGRRASHASSTTLKTAQRAVRNTEFTGMVRHSCAKSVKAKITNSA